MKPSFMCREKLKDIHVIVTYGVHRNPMFFGNSEGIVRKKKFDLVYCWIKSSDVFHLLKLLSRPPSTWICWKTLWCRNPRTLEIICSSGGPVAQLLARRTIDREVESSNQASDNEKSSASESPGPSPCKFHQLHGNETSSCSVSLYVHISGHGRNFNFIYFYCNNTYL